MKLRSPQPNQMFMNLPKSGNTYTSNENNVIEAPDNIEDQKWLINAGCQLVQEEEKTEKPSFFKNIFNNEEHFVDPNADNS